MLTRLLRAALGLSGRAKCSNAQNIPHIQSAQPVQTTEYAARIDQERSAYRNVLNVHELPKIAMYWHLQHLMPKFRHFGISHPGEIFEIELLKRCRLNSEMNQVVSIGSGNCDLEVRLAEILRANGCTNFAIQCLDLNPDMLHRGIALANERGVAEHIEIKECDFNAWHPEREYDVAIASQALHHVLKLEHLLDSVRASLKSDGAFLVSDMIGRNGHMRWPEALEIVHEFWHELPDSYRYNHQLNRHEELYENWDCSVSGFEGIRAQDILPLLIERFQFEMFLGFGNVIDPFVDRGFGHHFSKQTEWDRNFIDRVHARDDEALDSGRVKPTHAVAILQKQVSGPARYLGRMTPEFAVRKAAR